MHAVSNCIDCTYIGSHTLKGHGYVKIPGINSVKKIADILVLSHYEVCVFGSALVRVSSFEALG